MQLPSRAPARRPTTLAAQLVDRASHERLAREEYIEQLRGLVAEPDEGLADAADSVAFRGRNHLYAYLYNNIQIRERMSRKVEVDLKPAPVRFPLVREAPGRPYLLSAAARPRPPSPLSEAQPWMTSAIGQGLGSMCLRFCSDIYINVRHE